MPHYRILPGASFRDVDGTVKTGGESIELPEDLAAQHADKLELPAGADEPDAADEAHRVA